MIAKLLYSILHYSFLIFVLCGAILFITDRRTRSTQMLIGVLVVSGLSALALLLSGYDLVSYNSDALNPVYIIGGTLVGMLLFYYALFLAYPGLSTRCYFVFLIPLATQIMLLLIAQASGITFRTLVGFSDVMKYINEPNVWFRLLLLLFTLFYAIALVVLGMRALRWNTPQRKTLLLSTFAPAGLALTFFLTAICFPVGGRIVNNLYAISYVIILTWHLAWINRARHQVVATPAPKRKNTANLKKVIQPLFTEPLLTQASEDAYRRNFGKLYPTGIYSLRQGIPGITRSEELYCTFVQLNLTTNEIARLLGINQKSVTKIRYRLRLKMNIEEGTDMDEFIRGLIEGRD